LIACLDASDWHFLSVLEMKELAKLLLSFRDLVAWPAYIWPGSGNDSHTLTFWSSMGCSYTKACEKQT